MGWWEDIKETVSDAANIAINIGTNTVTGGLAGYNPEEGFTTNAGVTNRIINEASGANAKKEDEYSQRVVEEQRAAQQDLIDKQTEQARLQDVRASSSARAIRNTARMQGGSTQGLGGVSSSDEQDFLGL